MMTKKMDQVIQLQLQKKMVVQQMVVQQMVVQQMVVQQMVVQLMELQLMMDNKIKQMLLEINQFVIVFNK